MDDWLIENLACPRHQTQLSSRGDALMCPHGCEFPVVDGVPVMILGEADQTMDLVKTSLRQARQPSEDGGLYVESVGLNDDQKRGIVELARTQRRGVDPVVSYIVAATNGIAYKSQVGKLAEYPIPTLRLPPSDGKVFLDIGCNWGRWCIAAARKGYKVVGIDPSLGAVMAAKRVARQLGIDARYVVGDARFLPFKSSVIDRVFSYSVLQHLSREHVALVVAESGRVLRSQGAASIQMPTKVGVRCLYHQMRRGFREARGFEVRYWTLPSLRKLFSSRIGPTTFSVDCFFGIGLQFADLRFMPIPLKLIVSLSELLRLTSRYMTPLTWTADSVYVTSSKTAVAPPQDAPVAELALQSR